MKKRTSSSVKGYAYNPGYAYAAPMTYAAAPRPMVSQAPI